MIPAALKAKWLLRFADNDTFNIDEADLREFTADLKDTFTDNPQAIAAVLATLGRGLKGPFVVDAATGVKTGEWWLTATGIYAAARDMTANAAPVAGPNWQVVVLFSSLAPNLQHALAGATAPGADNPFATRRELGLIGRAETVVAEPRYLYFRSAAGADLAAVDLFPALNFDGFQLDSYEGDFQILTDERKGLVLNFLTGIPTFTNDEGAIRLRTPAGAGKTERNLTLAFTAAGKFTVNGVPVLLEGQASGIALPDSTVVVFSQDAEYPFIASGSFTVQVAGRAPGKVVSLTLGASATLPALDGSIFILPPSGGAIVAGKEHRLMFQVMRDLRILYTITPLS